MNWLFDFNNSIRKFIPRERGDRRGLDKAELAMHLLCSSMPKLLTAESDVLLKYYHGTTTRNAS